LPVKKQARSLFPREENVNRARTQRECEEPALNKPRSPPISLGEERKSRGINDTDFLLLRRNQKKKG